jgi:hypothetical protein
MPIERGSAIRNTTTEGGTSFAIVLSLSFSVAIPGSFDLQAVARGSYNMGGIETFPRHRNLPRADFTTKLGKHPRKKNRPRGLTNFDTHVPARPIPSGLADCHTGCELNLGRLVPGWLRDVHGLDVD